MSKDLRSKILNTCENIYPSASKLRINCDLTVERNQQRERAGDEGLPIADLRNLVDTISSLWSFGSRNLCDLASEANHKDAYQSAGVLYTMFIDYSGRALEVSRAILSY
jgi:hypothetical protein